MQLNLKPVDEIQLPADFRHYGVDAVLHPRLIIVHATAGRDSRGWLSTDSHPPVSTHVLIAREGLVYRIVPDSRVAWHAGRSIMFPGPHGMLTNVNNIALGLELENANDGTQAYTTQQYEQAARCIGRWYSKFGYLPLLSHAALDSRKTDPAGFEWLKLARLVFGGA
jgi:N-acetyl-anhydromuramyl-L-alanine amidase AmpD